MTAFQAQLENIILTLMGPYHSGKGTIKIRKDLWETWTTDRKSSEAKIQAKDVTLEQRLLA